MKDEPVFRLPALGVLGLLLFLGAACWLAWPMTAPSLGLPPEAGPGMGLGRRTIIMVAILMALGWVAIGPWKRRAAGDWMNWWLGGTVGRLMAVPVAAYLLYSPPLGTANTLIVSAAGTYLLLLMAETACTAASIGRQLRPPSDRPTS